MVEAEDGNWRVIDGEGKIINLVGGEPKAVRGWTASVQGLSMAGVVEVWDAEVGPYTIHWRTTTPFCRLYW